MNNIERDTAQEQIRRPERGKIHLPELRIPSAEGRELLLVLGRNRMRRESRLLREMRIEVSSAHRKSISGHLAFFCLELRIRAERGELN